MSRYVIRVVYPNGVAWLRHGNVVGVGSIVRFRDKKTAEINLEFIREGLDADAVASVVKIAESAQGQSAVDPSARSEGTTRTREKGSSS